MKYIQNMISSYFINNSQIAIILFLEKKMYYTQDGAKKESLNQKISSENITQEQKNRQDINSVKLNQTTYLFTNVQMSIKGKKQKEEPFKAVCMCIFKNKESFILRIMEKIKNEINILSIQKQWLEEVSISNSELSLVTQKQMMIQETLKKNSKTIKLRFHNKFVRHRWFIMLKNLRYYLIFNKNKKLQTMNVPIDITGEQQWLQPGQMPFSFNGTFDKCRRAAKQQNKNILPIVYKQTTFYVVYAEFQFIHNKGEHLGCLLILYEHKKVVYLIIAYSNMEYYKLQPNTDKKSEIEQRLRKKEHIHIIEKWLSQLQWSSSNKRQIIFRSGKTTYELYLPLPELKEHWEIFLLNKKYNMSVEPQIADTLQIFYQFRKEKQSIEALQAFFSACPSQSQQKLQKSQNKQISIQSQSKKLKYLGVQRRQQFMNLVEKMQLLKSVQQKQLIIQKLHNIVNEIRDQLKEVLNQYFAQSEKFDMSISGLSLSNLNLSSIQSKLKPSQISLNNSTIKQIEDILQILNLIEQPESGPENYLQKDQQDSSKQL